MAVTVLDDWSATADSDPTGSPTISAGSNRAFILVLIAENSAADLVVSTMTVGGQSATQSYEYYVDQAGDDHVIYTYLWDEAAISAMSGTSISYADNRVLSKRGFGTATYAGVDQTTFPKGQDQQANTSNATTLNLTTTSSSGDRIVALGQINSGSRTFTDWDTLSEQFDLDLGTGGARLGIAHNPGGDGTTTITISGLSTWAGMGIVLGQSSNAVAFYYNTLIRDF